MNEETQRLGTTEGCVQCGARPVARFAEERHKYLLCPACFKELYNYHLSQGSHPIILLFKGEFLFAVTPYSKN